MEYNIEFAADLVDFIRKEIKKELKNLTFVNTYSGKVTAVGNGVANVQLAGSDTILTNLKNRTNVTLNINDEVIIVVLKNNLNNCFIGWRK